MLGRGGVMRWVGVHGGEGTSGFYERIGEEGGVESGDERRGAGSQAFMLACALHVSQAKRRDRDRKERTKEKPP